VPRPAGQQRGLGRAEPVQHQEAVGAVVQTRQRLPGQIAHHLRRGLDAGLPAAEQISPQLGARPCCATQARDSVGERGQQQGQHGQPARQRLARKAAKNGLG
jgi:hypothetical protein